jgi:hypothetical protein
MVGVGTPRSLDDWVMGLKLVPNQIIRVLVVVALVHVCGDVGGWHQAIGGVGCKWVSRFFGRDTKVSALLRQFNYMDLCVLGSMRKWYTEDISSVQAQIKKKVS